ncbi:diguanylate cyclase [Ectopseudomonas mendocina]|uniref:diguanylate cyclase n=1 Tax=Ectopseudomonas mendocina TaxID=300 RepID=A0ABZ2RI72_ECTME
MSDETQRWKSKYLEGLEQQEQREQLWQTRLDLLRRGLVRSSLAAEGSDKAVDSCMQELRELLRRNDIDTGMSALIPRLEKAVLLSEKRREERVEQNIAGITRLTSQLLTMDLPRDVRKSLKQFSRQIEQRASHSSGIPGLLSELGSLQEQVLDAVSSDTPRPGFLQRLFGSSADGSAAATTASEVPQAAADSLAPEPLAVESYSQPVKDESAPEPVAKAADTVDAPLEAPAVVCAENVAAAAPSQEQVAMLASAPADEDDETYSLPDPLEPGYSTVAPHIAACLLRLLDELQLPSHHQAQEQTLRQRIDGGLNWYELVPVLDDIVVLIRAMSSTGEQEFVSYLKQLNQRLESFLGTLSEAHEGYSESVESVRSFNQELREQVSGLQASVQEAVDLPSLKMSLEERLDGLLTTVVEHQKTHEGREAQITQRLQELTVRVAEMEQEAQGFRDHLEEQRQKALIDPLTGLSNRAGWNERLEIEMARLQRYGGELLMAILDIDYFKRINDSYGHQAGDKVLRIIASELAKRLRKTDFIARFGGEEFVILLPSTPLEGGEQLLQSLRSAIEQCPFHFRGERVVITLSGGLSAFSAGEPAEDVFERADQALYRAKNGGRNRIELG